MYSGGNNSDSNKGPHPYSNYSSPGSSHDLLEPSASSDYTGGSSAISAQHASNVYAMHQHHQVYAPHFQQLVDVEQQQRFLYNPQEQWPQYLSQPCAASNYTSSSMSHIAGNLSGQEEEHQLVMGAYPQSLHLQGLNVMEQFFHNEQLVRRMQASEIDSKLVYDSSSSHGYGSAAAAGARYEEACTPRPRWTPTQEQIQILESIFKSGTTTPSRDMIVDIAAQLRKYGNIAEANVFYWFQNRKARAKRKLQPPLQSP